MPSLSLPELLQFASALAIGLETCEIRYYVSHPLVCRLLGDAAAQGNLVVVAAIAPTDADALIAVLSRSFYVHPEDIVETSAGSGGFALRHPDHQQIAEVWQQQSDEFSLAKMERRIQYHASQPDSGIAPFWICTLEDAILDRLLFEPNGYFGSQWQGLLKLLRTQSPDLDYAYLGEWASRLGISRILGRALLEAEI